MCEPATIVAASTLAISTASAVADYAGQEKNRKANTQAANAAARAEQKDIAARSIEEQIAAAQQGEQINKDARSAASLARLSALEAGVSGNTTDAITADVEGQRLAAQRTNAANLKMTLEQLQRGSASIEANRQSRINSVPGGNPFLTGLQIAKAGVDTASTLTSRKPPSAKR